MELHVYPIYVICAGIFISAIFYFAKIPHFIIAALSGILVVYTIYLHISMYSTEWNTMSSGAWISGLAPTLLTSAVVVVSIGYIILYLKKPKSSYTPSEPKKSSSFTDSIGNALNFVANPTTTKPSESSNLTQSGRREYISALDRLI